MTTIVLFGGISDERRASVALTQNLIEKNALAWFVSPTGAVHDVAVSDLLAHQRPLEVDFVPSRPAIFPDLEQALDTLPVEDPVFVVALRGSEGVDARRMLDARNIPTNPQPATPNDVH